VAQGHDLLLDRVRGEFSMSDSITSQFIRHYHPWFTLMILQQPIKEPFRRITVPPLLEKHINHLPILVNSPPQVMLFAIHLDEYFVNEESIAEPMMPTFQSSRI
jgi:hypothetical protein